MAMYRALRWIGLVVVGVAIGVAATLLSRGPGETPQTATPRAGEQAAQVWTCSMHPQVRLDHPGQCPICGMDLEPVSSGKGGGPGAPADAAATLTLSEHARRMAAVATTEVRRRELAKEIRTVGKVELDETRVAYIAARVAGRVDQVFADFPGTPVRKGEHLVAIYSPDLLATQEEYLDAVRRERAQQGANGHGLEQSLSAASRRRLALWGITDQQLDQLAESGQAQTYLVVYAPMGGTVIEKRVRPGQYVEVGDMLYTIADLAQVWLVIDVYESDLAWVRIGQPVEVVVESEPNRPIQGTVGFVEPLLSEATRTVRVRVVVANDDGRLKPGMYAQAVLRVAILADGTPAPTGLAGKYVCPMHPYVVADQPADCRVCGMPLEKVPGVPAAQGAAEAPKVLAVPAEAVLTTGRRALVYVEDQPGQYRLVEPKLGPRAGDYYPVLAGLVEGDRVVTRGNFLLDSQFQISGRRSLLYPEGAARTPGAHAGHAEPTARAPEVSTPSAPAPEKLTADELANINQLPADERAMAMAQKVCPVSGAKLGSMGMPYKVIVRGRPIFLCCKGCEGEVNRDPEAVLKRLDAPMGDQGDDPRGQR